MGPGIRNVPPEDILDDPVSVHADIAADCR